MFLCRLHSCRRYDVRLRGGCDVDHSAEECTSRVSLVAAPPVYVFVCPLLAEAGGGVRWAKGGIAVTRSSHHHSGLSPGDWITVRRTTPAVNQGMFF